MTSALYKQIADVPRSDRRPYPPIDVRIGEADTWLIDERTHDLMDRVRIECTDVLHPSHVWYAMECYVADSEWEFYCEMHGRGNFAERPFGDLPIEVQERALRLLDRMIGMELGLNIMLRDPDEGTA